MPNATVTVDLPASPEKLWAVLIDFRRFPDWFVMHDAFITEPPAEPVVGASFKQRVKIMGMPGEATWTMTKLQPPTTIEMSGQGPMGIQLAAAFNLTPTPTGATVTCTMEFTGTLLAGPLGTSLQKAATKDTTESLTKLATLTT